MSTARRIATWCLFALFAQAAAGQVALRSVTSARKVTVTHGAPDQAQQEPSREQTSEASYQGGAGSDAMPAEAARRTRSVRLKSTPSDPEKERAADLFSKFLLAFNDKAYGKRIMAQQGPSYRLDDWHYFPVRIKSLTSRKVEDQVIMVNPETGKYRLEGSSPKAKEG